MLETSAPLPFSGLGFKKLRIFIINSRDMPVDGRRIRKKVADLEKLGRWVPLLFATVA